MSHSSPPRHETVCEDKATRVHYKTAPEDKVALSQKLLYSAATVAIIPGMQIIERIAQVVLNICLGINPTLIGVGIAIFRVWDAFTDPFMGNLSDNCRSRWGRRRPFIVVGGVLCALTFPLMWLMSRDWTPWTAFLYFAVSYTHLTLPTKRIV